MSRLMFVLFTLGIASTSAGCVSRVVTRFEDNQKAPLTALELDKRTDYFVMRKFVHQFYLCQDTGDKLICKLSCDGKNDVICPAASASGNSTTTNVR